MRDIKLILFVAVFWLVGGAVLGVGIQSHTGGEWVAPCTSLSVLLGMILLLVVMRQDQAQQRLFGETDNEMPFNLGLAALIVVPGFFIAVGLLWWAIAQFYP